jgi:hypothetical protein
MSGEKVIHTLSLISTITNSSVLMGIAPPISKELT